MVKYLKTEFGLTAKDARANYIEALHRSALNGHLDVVKYLKTEFGLTTEDALRNFDEDENGHDEVVKYFREWIGQEKYSKEYVDKVLAQLATI